MIEMVLWFIDNNNKGRGSSTECSQVKILELIINDV